MSYEEVAARKRAERDAKFIKEWLIPESKLPTGDRVIDFPETSGFLGEQEIAITRCSAPEIVTKIAAKEWTAHAVTSAFCHRSQIAHQLTNCLTEVLYTEALEAARELDRYQEETGKLRGPLHGVPIAVKDNVNLTGQASSIGFVALAYDPPEGAAADAVLATILKREGAVIHVKTNIPMGMMMVETVNHIYGRTTNPWNRKLTAGGSSGGAAAHQALRGAVIDVGSDIGGSVRIPAGFQGLHGLRPTSARYPTAGSRPGLPGFESVASVQGPLAVDLKSLNYYLSIVADSNPELLDSRVDPLPWREVQLRPRLKVGILVDDMVVRPTPPVVRAVETLGAKLSAAGHEVVRWDPKLHTVLTQTALGMFLSEGGQYFKDMAAKGGEPLFPALALFSDAKDSGVSALWKMQAQRQRLVQEWHQQFRALDLDFLVMPITPYAGIHHDGFRLYAAYSVVINALDFSALSVPVLKADAAVDVPDKAHVPRNEQDKYVHESYNPEQIDGVPVSLQLVGLRHDDEKLVAAAELIAQLNSK